MVQGCRFSIGGGKIENNAMPFLHKYFGNPFFSLIIKIFSLYPLMMFIADLEVLIVISFLI